MMRKEGVKKWIFDEYCDLTETQFRFKDKEKPLTLVSGVVHSMQIYPLDEVLTAPYLITEWRPDLITGLIDKLVPHNCRVTVVNQCNASICDKEEFWYGTRYKHEQIPQRTLSLWAECCENENLRFPLPNPFIPTDFELYAIETDGQRYPVILYDTPVMRVWYKQDTEFLKPKTILNCDFSSPMAYADPLNCNLTQMFVQLFKDQLNEYLYEAELASLRLAVSNAAHGITVSFYF